MPRKVFKKIPKSYSRKMVRIRTSGTLNAGGSRSGEVITTVPENKVLVIETISVNIRTRDRASTRSCKISGCHRICFPEMSR